MTASTPGATRDLCIMACVFCKDPQFHAWLTSIDTWPTSVEHGEVTIDEKFAKAFILAACGVTSRNELDTDPEAAKRFHRLVRGPFLAWKGGDHVDD